jgi:hypothetical protein
MAGQDGLGASVDLDGPALVEGLRLLLLVGNPETAVVIGQVTLNHAFY